MVASDMDKLPSSEEHKKIKTFQKHTKDDYTKKGRVNSKHELTLKKIHHGDDSEDSEIEEEV